MRIVVVLRVSALPTPYCDSVATQCAVCHELTWRDASDPPETGDIMVCTACLPGYARTSEAVRSALLDGRMPDIGDIRPPTPAESAEDGAKVLSLFRAMADTYVDKADRRRDDEAERGSIRNPAASIWEALQIVEKGKN